MGVLKAKVNGVWEDISGVTTHEVVVSDTDPRQGVYKNAILWFDTTMPVGDRMKVWDPATSAWVTAVGGADGDFLPLAGGTLTGNLTLNGTNLGVNFTGGAGIYSWTDKPLTLREGTNGSQPRIINNDGGGGRDIIDTTNGDARYLRSAAGTSYNVSYLNGWTGTMDFRVNPLMVTMRMTDVYRNAQTNQQTTVEICDYPSGVPAPWGMLRSPAVVGVDTNWYGGNNWSYHSIVEARTDGVFLRTLDFADIPANIRINCTMSWAR